MSQENKKSILSPFQIKQTRTVVDFLPSIKRNPDFIPIIKELLNLGKDITNIETILEDISGDLVDYMAVEYARLVNEFNEKLEKLKLQKGDKGDSHIMTMEDRKAIADLITVPVVDRIIEKTQIIKEIPIISEQVKEVIREIIPEAKILEIEERIERDLPKFGMPIRDSLELLPKEDVDGIDQRLDATAIRGLEDLVKRLIGSTKNIYVPVGGGNGISTSSYISNVETPIGSLYDQVTGLGGLIWTVSNTPKYIIADGTTMFEGFGYSYSAGTITTVNPVTQFIKSFY